MSAKIAYFISYVLNPIFLLAFLPFFLVYKTTGDLNTAVVWSLHSFIFLLAIGLFMLIGVKKKLFTDIDISRREQRPLFYKFLAGVGVLYIVGLFIFDAPNILKIMALGLMAGVLIISLVNTKIKASLHLAALSALLSGIYIGYGGSTIYLFLLIPLVVWSRIKIKKHTLPETIVGWLVGSMVSIGMYGLFKLILYNYYK